ncbi:glycoside hydrolase family 2 TIM barrel-domain containing protein [Geofilum sp. OHC36d9]|uniref:glycoside hydrolase family 2 TIM barrel-domain containing protein n=1 Tax=Geofilum sp. OHC36d9 TaxID=3458413 RepID=UPI004033DC68
MKQILLLLLFGLLIFDSQAQVRCEYSINSNWKFCKGDIDAASNDARWENVSVPHCWNIDDVMDDELGYYRDTACYKRDLYIPGSWRDKEVFLVFDAIGISASVYINGQLAGSHTGGYTAFNIPITKYLNFSDEGNSKNQLFVKANNSYNKDIPPLSGDFTFFGGIYRDVHLVALDKVHFRMDQYNSQGVFWTTPKVSNESAELNLKGAFSNSFSRTKKVVVEHVVMDNAGKEVLNYEKKRTAKGGESVSFDCKLKLENPKLWSPENPYLYRLISRLKVDGKIVDQIENPIAFRWFKFDAENGFFLNGSPYKLIGASRHQDFATLGNALDDAVHIHDVELLKEMGGNFLRIAHYPQDEAVLEACDRLGVLTSIEIPLVNSITESEAFFHNSEIMLREMMAQYYNHPSIIIWAYMNEIFLHTPYEKGSDELAHYLHSTNQLFTRLENIIRENDPYRYTMMVGHGGGQIYSDAGLINIPKIFGWNIYTGWYDGKSSNIGKTMDKRHDLCKGVPILVTEYGADVDYRIHNFDPIRFDKSVEYAIDYHQEYIKAFKERKFISGMVVWNLADFSSETRNETTPHINSKGLLTYDRKPKDTYRFYRANFGEEPYLEIGSKEWNFRTGQQILADNDFVEQPVQVFSNLKEVEFFQNGRSLGRKEVINGIATFNVPFKQGENRLLVKSAFKGYDVADQASIKFNIVPKVLDDPDLPFQTLNISLGDKRFYTDYKNHENWLPAQEYFPGSWGYVGGEVYKMKNTKRQNFGSDINIIDSDMDAVYATQQLGIDEFRFDVPDGIYALVLHFCELSSNVKRQNLIYNLGSNGDNTENNEERVFSVTLNNKEFISNLSNNEELLPEKAVSYKTTVVVTDGKGISVKFDAIKGKPILNGIQLRKKL